MFVGRSSQLERLQDTVFAEDKPQNIAITGLGGTGKTQIALELAFRTREKHPDCSVFWLPATGAEILRQAFVEVGRQLGVAGIEDNQSEAKKLVQRHLSQDSAGHWLLIVDNVDDIELWNSELRDCLPRSRQGCIVFTSRSRKVATRIAAGMVIEVLEMDEELAMELLRKALIKKELLVHREDVTAMLEQLSFLPLAIVQAVAYINGNGISISEYVLLLGEQEQDVIELLSEDFEDDWRYRDATNPVATTWLISFEHVQKLNPLAAEYMSFMACVVSKDIPLSLLPPAPSQMKMTDAIGTLDAYSFVRKREDGTLDIHRLVQLTTRNWLKRQEQWSIWADRVLARMVEVVPYGDYDKREVWTKYLPHAIHIAKLPELQEAKASMSLLDRIGYCEHTLGRFEASEWAHRKALGQKVRVLGKKHPETLISMNDVGTALDLQGKYREGEQMHRETLALIEEELGEEHPSALTSKNNLASTLYDQGKYKEAEKIQREILVLEEKVLGEEHPLTLSTKHNLANTLYDHGRYKEAEKMHREILALGEKVLGEEHPSTLSTKHSLASTLYDHGRYKEAEKMQRETLALGKNILGEEHPDVLESMYGLACTLRKIGGKNNEAILLMQSCVALREQILGHQHPHTILSRRVLNHWETSRGSAM